MIFAEVSKVRHYHSTVMNGFIEAWYESGANRTWGTPYIYAHESFIACLDDKVRANSTISYINVLDPDKRQLVRKALVECIAILKLMRSLRASDTLLVTTVFPTTMVLVEIFAKMLPKRNVVILQHSELEDAFLEAPPKLGSYGHANLLWHKVREFGSSLQIAVLAEYIAEGVRSRFKRSVTADQLHVLPMPMKAYAGKSRHNNPKLKCCFVGFNTKVKGYPVFESLAQRNPDKVFLTIGGGTVQHLNSQTKKELISPDAFFDELAATDIAIFPYVSGYEYSLSAAATDAISAGLHLLTFNRGCFSALRRAFGPETITICDTENEMHQYLNDPEWNDMVRDGRQRRLNKISASEFGPKNVGQALAGLMTGADVTP
ncbi:MAG: hypothetical protein QUV08_11180 [Parasphingorhabdus sp.]|nr:hypothetical protein [Parasphingorhabdus sp.]